MAIEKSDAVNGNTNEEETVDILPPNLSEKDKSGIEIDPSTSNLEIGSNAPPPPLRKEYAVSVRWEREMEEYMVNKRIRNKCCDFKTPTSSLEVCNLIFCCCANRIGGMFSLLEKADGTPILITGPCWPFCCFVTVPLIAGISGLVSYFFLFNENLPLWIAILYLVMVGITLLALSCVSCRDPGLLERVTDEEAGHGGWFWNEQVGSFRPTGAMYCRECKALIEDFDHVCPWTGTGIGRKNMRAFKAFVLVINLTCYFSVGLVAYGVIRGVSIVP